MQKNVWEDFYKNRTTFKDIPNERVIMAIFHNTPPRENKSLINILDVGCGSSANIIFAASQGYNVAGIDISETVINYSKKRFDELGLNGNVSVSNFCPLSFDDTYFDFIIDSGALCCVDFSDCQKAINEIYRTLKKGGRFFFTPLSDRHTSALSGNSINANRPIGGYREGITQGLKGYGNLSFYSSSEILSLLKNDSWNIISMTLNESFNYLDPQRLTESRWEVIAEKR